MEDIKNFSIFIMEDDKIQVNTLKKYIEGYSSKISTIVTDNFKDALEILSNSNPFSAYFLDISMDQSNENADGFEVARYINQHTNSPIIFTTAFPNYVYNAINEIHCTAYLLKPYTKKTLYKQLDNIFNNEKDVVIKTTDGIYIKLNYDDIYYFASHGRYVIVHTLHDNFTTRQYRLKDITKLFPKYFQQCHKSYVVNTKHIKCVIPYRHIIYLKNTTDTVPCSRYYKLLQHGENQ